MSTFIFFIYHFIKFNFIILIGDNMKKINNKLTIKLIIALLISILFVGGIPLIIVFASSNKLLMWIGIVCVGFGFYATPLSWISFGNTKRTKEVVSCIVMDNILSVDDIAKQLQMEKNDVIGNISVSIKNRYIEGYLFDNNILTVNTNVNMKNEAFKKCPNCGAKMSFNESKKIWECKYCGDNK